MANNTIKFFENNKYLCRVIYTGEYCVTREKEKEGASRICTEAFAVGSRLTMTRLKPYFCVWPARLSARRRAQSHVKI